MYCHNVYDPERYNHPSPHALIFGADEERNWEISDKIIKTYEKENADICIIDLGDNSPTKKCVENKLKCPKCSKKAKEMDEEANTLLHCQCGESFLKVIW